MSEGVLGDFLSFRNGKTSPDRANDAPYPVYGSNGIVGHSYETNVSQPCVVIGRVGSFCGSTYYASTPAWVTDNAMVALPEDVVETQFWFYALKSKRLNEYRQGSGQPLLNQTILRSIPFEAPEPMARRQIAAMLGALDDKIDSNRRAIGLAEKLGDARFSQVVDNQQVLTDVADITMGSSPPGDTYNADGEGLPFYQGVKDFGVRHPSYRVWTTEPVRTAEANATLISVRAPVGRLNRAKDRCCIGRGLAAVMSSMPSVCYYSLRAADAVWSPFEQEGTVFGSMNKKSLTSAIVPWPTNERVAALEAQLAPLDARITTLTEENQKLAALRDALLPELLSGRIRVPEAQETVLEATGK